MPYWLGMGKHQHTLYEMMDLDQTIIVSALDYQLHLFYGQHCLFWCIML